MRIVYNAVPAVAISPLALLVAGEPASWMFLALAIALANACVRAGPVAENYLALFGCGRRFSRWLIFITGTLLACLFACLAMIGFVTKGAMP